MGFNYDYKSVDIAKPKEYSDELYDTSFKKKEQSSPFNYDYKSVGSDPFALPKKTKSNDPFAVSKEKPIKNASLHERIGDRETPKLDWWKDNEDFVKFLEESASGVDTASHLIPDYYMSFLKKKVEDSSNSVIGKVSGSMNWALQGIGSIAGDINNAVKDIPILSQMSSLTGSAFKVVGNLIDLPMNMVRGGFTALASGHEEEALGNIWDAVKSGLSGGTEGKSFSFGDYYVRNMEDEARKSLGDRAHTVLDTDEWRKEKRVARGVGMLFDLAIDPTWLIGMTSTKVAKELSMAKGAISQFDEVARGTNLAKRGLNKEVIGLAIDDLVETGLNAGGKTEGIIKEFGTRTRNFLNEVAVNPDFVKVAGFTEETMGRVKKVLANKYDDFGEMADLMEGMVGGMKSLDKSAFDKFGRHSVLYSPKSIFSREKQIMAKAPFSYEPMARLFQRSGIGVAFNKSLDRILTLKGIRELRGKNLTKAELAEETGRKAIAFENIEEIYREAGKKLTPEEIKGVYTGFIEGGTDYERVASETIDIVDSVLPNAEKYGIKYADELDSGIVDFGDVGFDRTGKAPKHFKMKGKQFDEYNRLLNTEMYDKLLAVPELRSIRDKWLKMSDEIRNMEKTAQTKLFESLVIDGRVSKKILDDGTEVYHSLDGKFTDLPVKDIAKKLDKDHVNYISRYETEAYREFKKGQKSLIGTTDLKPIEGLGKQQHHVDLMPTDWTSPKFLSMLYKEPTTMSKLLSTGISEKQIFRDIVGKINGKDRFLRKRLFETNMNGNPLKAGQKRMVDVWDTDRMNWYSKEGLIKEGFTGEMFETGLKPLADRIELAHKRVAKIDGALGGLREGRLEGWLVPLKTEKGTLTASELAKKHTFNGIAEWEIGKGIFKNHYVPKKHSKALEKFSEGIMDTAKPFYEMETAGQKSLGVLRKMNKWWKIQATILHPSFHARNYLSNRMVMAGDGIPLHTALNAFIPPLRSKAQKTSSSIGELMGKEEILERLLHPNNFIKGKKGVPSRNKFAPKIEELRNEIASLKKTKVDFKGGQLELDAVRENLMDNNIIQRGLVDKDIYDDFGGAVPFDWNTGNKVKDFAKKYNLVGSENFIAKWGRDVGSKIEDVYGRAEYYLHLIDKKNFDFRTAGSRVNEMMVDYNSLKNGERWFKDHFAPFYMWQSRMAKAMTKKIVERPTMFSKWTQAQNDMHKLLETNKLFAPQLEAETEGIPVLDFGNLVKFVKGKPMKDIDVRTLSLSGVLPQTVINEIPHSPATLAKYFISQLTPFAKLPLETEANYSFHFNRELERYDDQETSFMGIKMSPKLRLWISGLFGLTKEANDIASITTKSEYTGKPYNSISSVLFKNIVGARSYQRDESRQIAKVLSKLRTLSRTNTRESKYKVDPESQAKHAENALMYNEGIDVLEWYREYILQVQNTDDFETYYKSLPKSRKNKIKKNWGNLWIFDEKK